MDVTGNKSELRAFGLVLAVIIAAVFGVFLPWLFELGYPVWPWIVSGILILLALLFPSCLAPIHWLLLRIAGPLGRFNSVVILSLVYFVLVCPMGLLMRLFGRDPIHRRFDKKLKTYRKESEPSTSLEVPF